MVFRAVVERGRHLRVREKKIEPFHSGFSVFGVGADPNAQRIGRGDNVGAQRNGIAGECDIGQTCMNDRLNFLAIAVLIADVAEKTAVIIRQAADLAGRCRILENIAGLVPGAHRIQLTPVGV